MPSIHRHRLQRPRMPKLTEWYTSWLGITTTLVWILHFRRLFIVGKVPLMWHIPLGRINTDETWTNKLTSACNQLDKCRCVFLLIFTRKLYWLTHLLVTICFGLILKPTHGIPERPELIWLFLKKSSCWIKLISFLWLFLVLKWGHWHAVIHPLNRLFGIGKYPHNRFTQYSLITSRQFLLQEKQENVHYSTLFN